MLVTGSAGRIGRAVVQALRSHGCFVRGLDRAPTVEADESVVGSIGGGEIDLPAALRDIGTLIHLAATPTESDFVTRLVPDNIVAVHAVLEAARAMKVGRVILASSCLVTFRQRLTGPFPIPVESPPQALGWYGATKVFLETAGRTYAETAGGTVLVARLGWCPRDPAHAAELAPSEWGRNVYLSPGDAGRFFVQAVQASQRVPFAIVYVCSRSPTREYYDHRPARQLVGFNAQDTWPAGCEDLLPDRRR